MLETVVTSSMALVGKAVINHGTKNALDLLVKKIKEQKWKHGSEIGKSIYNDIVDNDKTYLKYIDICISKYLFSYTILDPEQKKNLSDIYHPIKIKKVVKDSESKMVLINDDFFINDKNITNISGTAGPRQEHNIEKDSNKSY
ncbi:hypothetical protein [Dryocola sp. BD586]|uniref:hypothetical protein n=1 Tax=Dryocola sp. BD586 TaxID=3133271 RepID=UPI003F500E12